MKNEQIIASWNKIEPGDSANARMLSAIMEQTANLPKNRRNPRLKWGALAACFLVIVCVIVISHPQITPGAPTPNPNGMIGREDEPDVYPVHPILKPGDEGYINPPVEPIDPETMSATALLTHLGLNAEVIENPTNITVSETPHVSRKDAVEILKNAELLADCTVEKISRIRILEPDSENVWFITMMTLSRNGTIRGRIEEEQFRVVNAAVTNEPVEFLSTPGLENCREQMRAAFILRKVGESDVWSIDETEIAVKVLGEYFAVNCMGYDGECIQYGDYSIPVAELD